MKRKLDRLSTTYLFTLDMTSDDDKKALEDLRKATSINRKRIKAMTRGKPWAELSLKLPRVKVYYRRPERPHSEHRTHLYGWGGSVRKDQNPKEADVYLVHE